MSRTGAAPAPSTLATSRGITIGSKRADVDKQYGAERDAAASTPAKLVTPDVQFTFEGDVVTAIRVGAP